MKKWTSYCCFAIYAASGIACGKFSSFSKFVAFLLDFSECKRRMKREHWPGRNRLEKIEKMTWKLEEKAYRSSRRKVLIRHSKIWCGIGILLQQNNLRASLKICMSLLLWLVPGRIELKGTTSQKLVQLQEREIELLEEREKQREVIERLKEDRAHYRSVADDLR